MGIGSKSGSTHPGNSAESDEIRLQAEEIKGINENLETVIKDRTYELEIKNKALEEYAFINAHKLRAPLARILGLVHLMKRMISVNTRGFTWNGNWFPSLPRAVNMILTRRRGSYHVYGGACSVRTHSLLDTVHVNPLVFTDIILFHQVNQTQNPR